MGNELFKLHESGKDTIIGELVKNDFIITDVQDAVDLLAESGIFNCSSIIVPVKNLDKKFFDLKTGIAGEILQKFSNYRTRLAIIGDLTVYKSKSLQDFIRESNRGGFIIFCDDINSALKKFEGNNIK